MNENENPRTIVVRVSNHDSATDYSLVFRKLREGLADQPLLAREFVRAGELCREIEELRRASMAAPPVSVRTFTIG